MSDYDLRFVDDDDDDFDYTSGSGFWGPGLPDGTDGEARNLDGFPFYVKHLNFDESQAYGATGTGLFAPFLNINGGTTILGFNTDEKVNGQNGTDISDPNTNALQFFEIPIIYLDLDHDGALEAYYQINLDINENNRLDVALEELQFYVSSPGDGVNGTGYATLDDWIQGGTYAFGGDFELVFDLDDLDGDGIADGGTGNTMILRDEGAGQGKQDYIFYFPVEMFGDVAPTDFLTLYSQFGPDPADDGGFAEWNTLKATQINGIKFNDLDADGSFEPGAGETGLEGFTIYIDINENGVLDDFEPWTQSDVDGQFSFFSLLPNVDYVIREVLDEADMSAAFIAANGGDASAFTPDGTWIQTTDPLDDGNQIVSVTDPGTYFVAVGNYMLFDISGVKYLDANADGSTAGDVGLAGVTIYIDMDGSGTFNAGDVSTVTGVDGSWSITGLDESYIGKTVYEDLTNGWYATVGGSGYNLTGVDRTDLDFANYQKGMISGYKYEDADGDETTTGDQSAWVGVTIKLLDGSGTYITETTTNASGYYEFTDLMPGDYKVMEVLPDGSYNLTDITVDLDGNVSGFDETVNFVNTKYGMISGYKYEDDDGDASTTGDQSAWMGVTIKLLDGDGVFIEETTTDANGYYEFDELAPGDYQVMEVLPDGSYALTDITVDLDGNVSGFDETVNFVNTKYGMISGYKYEDDDGDASTTGDQSAWMGVTIKLLDGDGVFIEETTTDANGYYEFDELAPGDYQVMEVLPNGSYNLTDITVDLDGNVSGFDETVDFVNTKYGMISGYKYEDDDGDASTTGDQSAWMGVTIKLLDGDGVFIEETTTDANGYYEFDELAPGDYQVMEVLPDGSYNLTDITVDLDGNVSGFDETVNFVNTKYGMISGYKYEDDDGDASTTGDQSAWAGVTIKLLDGDGVFIEETTTDANGYYEFDELAPGDYQVMEVLPDGSYALTDITVDLDGNVSGFDETVNFVNTKYGMISGYKYEDDDGDASTTGDQSAWAGVTIKLLDGDGVFIEETTTDANGYYEFDELAPGDYQVMEVLPNGSYNLTDITVDLDGNVSGFDETVNFVNTLYGMISGYKYEDDDGSLATTDDRTVWAGVTITLLDADMNEVASTDTNGSGYYEFKDLELGTYYVKETQPDGSSAISEIQVEVTGATSGFSETADFVNFRDMSVSGYKWADLNGDHAWSEGEGTLDGWTIYLDNDMDPTNGYIEAVVTGAGEWADGYYEFTGINTDDPLVAAAIEGSGMLYVYESVEPGFTQTYGDFSFAISSGLTIDGDLGATEQGNFGNHMMEGAVRTPGFWQSTLGQSLYNGVDGDEGDANGDGIPDGNKDFDAEGWSEVDLLTLFGVDTDGVAGNDEFAIWDVNGDGVEDAGDIFLTPEELLNWVDGGEKGGGRDYATILERDLGAAFLNTINNAAINGSSDPEVDPAIADYYADAVAFILDWDANFDGVSGGSKKEQASDWKEYGSDAHGVLGAYNESGNGMVEGTMLQVAMDGDDYSSLLVQNYLAVEGQLVA